MKCLQHSRIGNFLIVLNNKKIFAEKRIEVKSSHLLRNNKPCKRKSMMGLLVHTLYTDQIKKIFTLMFRDLLAKRM